MAALAVFILLTAPCAVSPTEARSLPNRDQWVSDVRAAMRGSDNYLDRRSARGGSKLAINFDIDNTALATHYDPGKAVHRVLRFANHARSLGIKLLFNTARSVGSSNYNKATSQLTKAGYVVTELCGLRKGESLTQSKQRCRQHFVDEGYTLIANVGNRSTDFVGGNYQRAYQLPNYNDQLS